MEHLTYFDNGKWRIKIGDTGYSGKAVDHLAAYEETGLEPEEIVTLKKREAQRSKGCAICNMKLEAVWYRFNGKNVLCSFCPVCGRPLKRVEE